MPLICLYLLTALLSFGDGCFHVLICVGTHLAGEFLVGAKCQLMYELLFVCVVIMLHQMALLNYGHVQTELMVDALDGILLH